MLLVLSVFADRPIRRDCTSFVGLTCPLYDGAVFAKTKVKEDSGLC